MFIGNLIANFTIFVVNLAVYLINRESKAVNETVIIIIVSVIGGVISLPIIIFALFHAYLCLTGRTTR
jgi:fumarate reductase subunit D